MNKFKNFTLGFVLLFLGAMVFISCDSDSDDIIDGSSKTVLSVDSTVIIDASAYDKWIYYSFSKGDTVGSSTVEELRDGTDWDIAFHRYDFRVNCGTSGPGKGGTYATNEIDFDKVTKAPESGYSLNDSIVVYNGSPMMGGKEVTVPGDTLLATSIKFQMTNSGPNYSISNEVFVVRTANGKYVKVDIKGYYVDSKSGHITMKYSYQADGTTKF